MTIPCLSLWQPWATAIALGIKKNETRSWATNYRGWLAIHAAKRKMTDEEAWMTREFPRFAIPVPLGAVVCIVRLVGCLPIALVKKLGVSENEQRWGNYDEGRWAWMTSPSIEIPEPIPLVGHRGLFRWEPPQWIQDRMSL